MADAVFTALVRDEIIMIEAGTGVGKTLAYLLPLIFHSVQNDVRVAVSTETRSLQKQILEKDLPVVEKLLGIEIEAEICMGASNYLCKRKLKDVLKKGDVGNDMVSYLDDFLSWEESTETGNFLEYEGRLSTSFRLKTARDPDGCSGKKCPYFNISHYFRARERWKNAKLLILNHSLLASHIALEKKLLPDFDCLVIDEAHRFPDIFSRSFENSADFLEIDKVISEAKLLELKPLFESFRNDFQSQYFLFPGQTSRLKEKVDHPDLKKMIEQLDLAEQDLTRQIDELNEMTGSEVLDEITILSILRKRIISISALFQSLSENPGDRTVHWIRRNENDIKMNYSLHMMPLNTGNMIRSSLIDSFSSLILTSATLTTGDFAYFAEQNGCSIRTGDRRGNLPERLFTLKLDSPFDYNNRLLIYLPQNMPDPSVSEGSFLQRVSEELKNMIELTAGGTFVLFTSNRSLKKVHDIIKDDVRFPYEIISQLDRGASQALSEFLSKKDSVLFGVSTFWQGIDIPGDDLRQVVIVRLPFQVPDNPLIEAKTEIARQNGVNTFISLQLPHAVILMKQGVGRLIRKNTDRGIVALLDPRILSRTYGKNILQSLPDGQIYRDFDDIKIKYRNLFKINP